MDAHVVYTHSIAEGRVVSRLLLVCKRIVQSNHTNIVKDGARAVMTEGGI